MSAIEPARIKLCGFTRVADVALACDLGVDFLGLIFAMKSARRLSLAQAETLRAAMAPQSAAVALFMDNPQAEVAAVVAHIAPHFLQFHGDERDDFCHSFGLPYIKTIAMAGVALLDIQSLCARFPHAAAFLLDGHAAGAAGGSSQGFD